MAEVGDFIYLGQTTEWDEGSAAIFLDLEDASAQALRVREETSQSAYSIEIENNSGTTLLGILGAAATVDMIDVASVVTTAQVLDIDANSLTTGKIVDLASTSVTTGTLLRVQDNSSDTGTRVVVDIIADHASATGTTALRVDQDAVSAVAVQIVGAALTTGKALLMSDLDALTSGIGIHVASSATAITGAGRLAYFNHTGATSTSGVLFEVASAATDETVVARVTASGLLAAGVALDITCATMTTGIGLDLGDLDGLTTGKGINVVSNSADTGTRALVQITNDNTAATGATCLSIQNDATAGAHIKLTGTGILGIDFTALGANDFLFDATAGTGSTAAPQTNAAVGFLKIKVAGTVQWVPYYNAT